MAAMTEILTAPTAPATGRTVPVRPVSSPALVRRDPPPPATWTWEPSQRWLRGYAAGPGGEVAVVDSRRPILVWEPGAKVPEYGFPAADVRTDLLVPGEAPREAYYRPKTPARRWFDLQLEERRIPAVAWVWDHDGLDGFFGVTWYPGVLDRWTEEDERVFAHPRDPHSRVDTLRSSRRIVVRDGDRVLADSVASVIVYETGLPPRYYLPREDVVSGELESVDRWSECPYKGEATEYWATVGDPEREIAWSYPDPLEAVSALAGRVAFYSERVTVEVDGVQAGRSQPARDAV
ncbi:DUF427 domain-containing protein [Microbacterium terricola]|uniref:DUF427 domain-containing protein n=1 Tax=Microbacterium terricola TaxID=344163 RepID=A0ABM8E1Z6_9MICO|nr:DUF427 domain-containing protein [Microbacterium terricola]UYK40466.1 DUF427 domain-containing protein [Microbacterium terricola]BDV31812.1 hypothetical protein Microterr_24720 [Microbacterium terricola]